MMLTATYSHVALQVPRSLQLNRIMMVTVFSGIGALIGVLPGGILAILVGMEWLMIFCVVFLLLPTALVFFSFKDIGKSTLRCLLWCETGNCEEGTACFATDSG